MNKDKAPEKKRKKGNHVNLVVIGHADSGKSTITGHLLAVLGDIPGDALEKYQKEADIQGKQNLKYAWVMDKLQLERERGITIDIGMSQFHTPRVAFTIIDAPGHRDFIKNMITGTSQADVALLVVSAAKGEFEAGFGENGQTREHALLAYTLGIKKMIVAINKMDETSIAFNKKRFMEVKEHITRLLTSYGYKLSKIPFIPLSGFEGDNLFEASKNLPWYKGFTLVEALDRLKAPKHNNQQPLRLPLKDVYSIGGVGTVVVGRIETGILKQGTTVQFAPTGLTSHVHSIEMHHRVLPEAGPGDFVGFHVDVDAKKLRRGEVAGERERDPPKPARSFNAQVIVMRHPGEIRPGYTPVVSCHTAHVACRFKKLLWTLDKRTGEKLEQNPRVLKPGQVAMVTLEPSKDLVVESFAEYPPLGRFAVRDLRRIVAVGVIQSVEKKEPGERPLSDSDSDD